jgi:hypothetical protein
MRRLITPLSYRQYTYPKYGDVPVKETGKSFDDAIKDLYWDVLGREPDAAGLAGLQETIW